jgi:hypothetical protein
MDPFIPLQEHSSPSGRSVRKFSLLDAMVVIAATAAGLAIDRIAWLDIIRWGDPNLKSFRGFTILVIILSVPVAAMWTTATLVLQLRHPRYRLRRLVRRPGMAACCAATSALAIDGGLAVCAMLGTSGDFTSRLILVYGLPMMAGGGVTTVWALSMMAGQYRVSSDWSERLGRLVEFYWVMTIPCLGWVFTI